MTDTRDAVQQFDLENYIQRFVPTPVQPDEWALTCPVCGKPDKLVVNVRKKLWHCWVCEEYQVGLDGKRVPVKGAGGLIALIQLLESCTREWAVGIVVSGMGYQSVPVQVIEEELANPQDQHGLIPGSALYAPEIPPPPAWKPILSYGNLTYLRQRGITEEDVRAFGITYCDAGRYAGRMVFPVWERGRHVYYQARAMWDDDDNPKFRKSMNPVKQPGMAGATEVLMNLDVARNFSRVALIEGPIDNVHVGPSGVTTFGKKISLIQMMKLWYAGVRALDLMWDGPTEREPMGAWPEMLKAAPLLSGLFDVRLIFIPYGDPGLYSRRDCDLLRAQGRPAAAMSGVAML